jgi:hypothetical protein
MVDVTGLTVFDTASPSIANFVPALNIDPPATVVAEPVSSLTGTASGKTGGFDMAFGLFNFRVDDDGVAELISINDSTPPMADPSTPPAIGGTPSTTPQLAPSEKEPRLETSTPSVGSNDFQDSPPSPTTAYCVECDAYHFVGARDFSSHEIAGCEDPWGALLPSTRRYPSANGLSTPSRSILRPTILITSRGLIRLQRIHNF